MKLFINLLLPVFLAITALKSYSGNRGPLLVQNNCGSQPNSSIKMLSSFLFTSGGNIADGNRVVFDLQYSNGIDANDAIKILNPGENFGLRRDNNILAIEARQPVKAGDTLFYNITNLVSQVYKLTIVAQNLSDVVTKCELIDRYLNTRKNISLSDSTNLTFEVTADPASRASNRLLVVFNNTISSVFPVQFTSIKASIVDKSIFLNWQVEHELNVQQYDIERSTDGQYFNSVFSAIPIYENENGGSYQFNDYTLLSRDNFYRVRSIDKNGLSVYSDKVRVSLPVMATTTMNIYPNPVTSTNFQLRLNNMLPGKYFIKLTNNFGQQVYISPVNVSGNNFVQTISLDAHIATGDYNLTLWKESGPVKTQKIIIQ